MIDETPSRYLRPIPYLPNKSEIERAATEIREVTLAKLGIRATDPRAAKRIAQAIRARGEHLAAYRSRRDRMTGYQPGERRT